VISNGRTKRRSSYKKPAPDMQSDFSESQASYRAAKRSTRFQAKRSGIPSMGASADFHYGNDTDYLWMSEIARDIDRNDCVAGQILDRVVDNEVQGGFRLNCMTGDEKLDTDLEQRWTEEASDPVLSDVTGTRTFHDQERLVAREEKLVGDIFALPVGDEGVRGAVQLIENYRCRRPDNTKKNIINGIELSKLRQPIKYYFTNDTIEARQQTFTRNMSSVDANNGVDELTGMVFPNVWHVLRQKRPSQTRGITAFAPLFDIIGIHDDVQFSKLVQQQIASFFAIIRERDLGWQEPDSGDDTVEGLRSVDDSYGQTQEELTPGMELNGLAGEKIHLDNPNIPNPEWFQHVKLLLTFVGINLGAPLVMVLMDAGETNFSGYRGAIDQARLGFRCNQRNRINKFYRPYFNWRLRTWLDDDPDLLRRFLSNRRKVNLFRHEWGPPEWPYIEPTKDALADLIRESNTLTSPRRRAAERGTEYSTIVREAVEDRANGISLAIEAADAINTKHGLDGLESVTWQHLYQPPMPQGVTLQMNAVGDVEEPAQPTQLTQPTPNEGK